MEARHVLLLNGVLRAAVLLLQLRGLRLCQTLLLIQMITILRQTLLLLVDQRLLMLLGLRLVLLLLRLLLLLLFLPRLALSRRRVGRDAQPEQRHRADARGHDHPIQDIDSHCPPHCMVRHLMRRPVDPGPPVATATSFAHLADWGKMPLAAHRIGLFTDAVSAQQRTSASTIRHVARPECVDSLDAERMAMGK